MNLPFIDGVYKNSYDVIGFFPELDYSREPDELLFHTDWNWIMKVVEKIESLGYVVNIMGKPNSAICMIRELKPTLPIAHYFYGAIGVEDTAQNKKEAVYKAIDTFIDWYNEQDF